MKKINVLDHGFVELVKIKNKNKKILTFEFSIKAPSKDAAKIYKQLFNEEMPKNFYRCTYPPVGSYSQFRATLNLYDIFKFVSKQLHEHAQREIQQYAQAMLELIEPIITIATATFKENLV